jgi:phycobilisome core component
VIGIQIMKGMIKAKLAEAGMAETDFVDEPFDHILRELSEVSV